MNNYDLTKDKVFSENILNLKNYDVFTGKVINHPLIKFEEKSEHYYRTKNMYVGSAKDIIGQMYCEGFGSNNGFCDCCGGPTQPWMSYGLCERCTLYMEGDDNKPFFLKNNTSQEEQSPWFVV